MILNRDQLRNLSIAHNLISPFEEYTDKGNVPYGATEYEYIVRLSNKLFLFRMTENEPLLSPKGYNPDYLKEIQKDDGALILKPKQCALGKTIETLNLPSNIYGIPSPIKHYVSCGLLVSVEFIPSLYQGQLTLLISNPTCYRIAVYPNEGIMKIVFIQNGMSLH